MIHAGDLKNKKGRSIGNKKLLHERPVEEMPAASEQKGGKSYESKRSAAHPKETGKSMAKGKKWDGFSSAGQEATASLVCIQKMVQQRKGEGWSRQVVLCREASAHFLGDTCYTQGLSSSFLLP